MEEAALTMQFVDGHSFKSALAIAKVEAEEASMMLTPTHIEIFFMNSDSSANHRMTIEGRKIGTYIYNFRDEAGELKPYVAIGFKTVDLFNTLRGLARVDSLRIDLHDGRLAVQIIKAVKDSDRSNIMFVSLVNREHNGYIDLNDGYSKDCSVSLVSQDFSDVCTQAGTQKCKYLEIAPSTDGIVFRGITPSESVAFISPKKSSRAVNLSQPNADSKKLSEFLAQLKTGPNGATPVVAPTPIMTPAPQLLVATNEELMTIRLLVATAKALTKIKDVGSKSALLEIYFARAKPVKIVSPLGHFGSYIISLRTPLGIPTQARSAV